MLDILNVDGLVLENVELLLNNPEEFNDKFEDELDDGGIVVLGVRTMEDGNKIDLKVDRFDPKDPLRFMVSLESDPNGFELFGSFEKALTDYQSYHPNKNNW